MANRIRARSDARQLARGQLFEIGRELRIARLASGKRQVDVGRAARITAAYVSRIERGRAPGITHRTLTELAAVVGIRLWMRAYPTGRRLLDAPQLELFTKLTGRSDARLRWRTEVPVPIAGDLRAADALATLGTATVQFELITRLADFQAQSRAALLKKRDLGADRLILVIKASHANRRALPKQRPPWQRRFLWERGESWELWARGSIPAETGSCSSRCNEPWLTCVESAASGPAE